MTSTSSLPPPLTPRFRAPTDGDGAEEEPFLPRHNLHGRYTEDSERARRFLQRRTWLGRGRGRVVLVSALLSLGVWALLVAVPAVLHPAVRVATVPAVDFERVRELNVTLLGGGKGKEKWTVAVPPGVREPLRPRVYAGICRAVRDMAGGHGHGHRGYYAVDAGFVDPAEGGHGVETGTGPAVCAASLTYMLESNNAGFGVALMGLWSAYGLAKREGRSFFVNDRDWAWGNYTSFFLRLPTPPCAPPPPHWLLPCPHTAKHRVVSAATHTFAFGHAFTEQFEDPRAMGARRQKHIFALARAGYEDLFRIGLRPEDQDFVEVRKKALAPPRPATTVVAVHVRRGDGRARAWEFASSGDGLVPAARYVAAAAEARGDDAGGGGGGGGAVYASDDVHVYEEAEFVDWAPAQGDVAAETWLGELEVGRDRRGFVAAEFWELEAEQRVLLGRAYLRDIKILGEVAGRGEYGTVVCGGASATCRLLAVVMGWEAAVERGRWRNVDGGEGWSGVAW